MKNKRAKNLSDADIKNIVEILDGWTGKLTWDLLIDAVTVRMFNRYTRQALFKHERVRNAYELKKKNSSKANEPDNRVSPEMKIALERIARLEAENRRLESENEHLLEQFTRWAYNAHVRGLGKDFLSQPLPGVNRGQTVLQK